MSIFAKFKRIFIQKNNTKSIININDILPLPSRDMFKDNPKIISLIDYYQNHFFDILSTKKTLVSKNLNIDDLYDALLVNTIPLKINAKLYEYNNLYYLLIKPNLTQIQDFKRLVAILSEFGKLEREYDYFESKLLEYGNELIAKDALEYLYIK